VRDRRNGRQNHDRQYDGGRKQAGTAQRGAEQRNEAELLVQPVGGGSNGRDDDEDAPQAEHDAGNGGQHFDDQPEHEGKALVQEVLREEDRHRQPEKAADQQGEERAVKRPPNAGKDPEFLLLHVPGGAGEKVQMIVADGRQSLPADLPDDIGDEQDQHTGGGDRERPEHAVDEILEAGRRLADRGGGARDGERTI
jgi:hypothetical protein